LGARFLDFLPTLGISKKYASLDAYNCMTATADKGPRDRIVMAQFEVPKEKTIFGLL